MARLINILAVIVLLAGCSPRQNIVFSNDDFMLELSPKGYAVSLKAGGSECLKRGVRVPLCEIMQERPYDNENFLMFPAKPRKFASNSITCSNDTLYVRFKDTWDVAVIAVDVKPHYMGFELVRVDYKIDEIGVKRQTEIDALALIQLPVRRRTHFGEWLNVTWDRSRAVCLMGADERTRIDSFEEGGALKMYAGLEHGVGLCSRGAVLLACKTDSLLAVIDEVERDYGMPRGVQSRLSEQYKWSYYELRDLSLDNIDSHIEWAKKGSFRTMVVYYPEFARTCGHFLWKENWSIQTLREVCSRIENAGLIPGLHIHYSKVSVDDPYVCGGTPDPRLNYVAERVLSRPVGPADRELALEGSTDIFRTENGRRIVRIVDEFISYESITPDGIMIGCERGLWNTKPASYPAGALVRQPDMDDWPRFIRIDQNSLLQAEIAGRLAEIYRECGFRFVYFDGAEDVPMPYWYNVSRAQLSVYERLDPAPLFAEGALKSHFGWHILSRGNAFDLFRPEQLRAAMQKYTLRCARQNADNFTAVDFGWMDYLAPSEGSVGMQPDHFAYVFSKAAAWDSPVGLMGKLDQIEASARSEDNFRIISEFEQWKNNSMMSPLQKRLVRDPAREWFIYEGELLEWTKISDGPLRAFSFKYHGKPAIVYWHVSDPAIGMTVIVGSSECNKFKSQL